MDPIEGIVQFNLDRGLTDFCPTAEYKMLFEELQEFLMAAAQDDTHEMVDALCDAIVVAVGGLNKLGYAPDKALQETVEAVMALLIVIQASGKKIVIKIRLPSIKPTTQKLRGDLWS
jgi:hypothetical protein